MASPPPPWRVAAVADGRCWSCFSARADSLHGHVCISYITKLSLRTVPDAYEPRGPGRADSQAGLLTTINWQ